MAISYVGATVGDSMVLFPTHLAGDLLIAHFNRSGGTFSSATAPAGWTEITRESSSNAGGFLCWRFADGIALAVSLPNATSGAVMAYRGASGVGGFSTRSTAGAGGVRYPAITMQKTNGTSWVVASAGSRLTTTTISGAPNSTTFRISRVSSSDQVYEFDTAGGVTSWPEVTTNSTSTPNIVFAVEVLAAGAAVLPIRLGNTQVTKAYLGTTPITRIYLGTTRIMRDRRLHRPRLIDRRRPLRRAA